MLSLECPGYPPLLKAIYDPPPVLYFKGKNLDEFPVPLAVVGTRLPTNYGKIITEALCKRLASMGICIVSGLARGVDTLAHKSALEAGGETIAVFGCGLSHIYPPENRQLCNKIVEQGTIVSEFPVTMRPDKNNFPARNRVISGLSHGHRKFEIEKNVEREWHFVDKLKLEVLSLECPGYPPLLKVIYDPPPVLYFKGKNLDEFTVPLAVVGTRLPTNYGKIITEALCKRLASMGICIVSGLARGVDTLAHKSAVEAGGETIAVFGCGLSHIYPPENRQLCNKIVEQGTIVFEFPVTMR